MAIMETSKYWSLTITCLLCHTSRPQGSPFTITQLCALTVSDNQTNDCNKKKLLYDIEISMKTFSPNKGGLVTLSACSFILLIILTNTLLPSATGRRAQKIQIKMLWYGGRSLDQVEPAQWPWNCEERGHDLDPGEYETARWSKGTSDTGVYTTGQISWGKLDMRCEYFLKMLETDL